MMLASAAVWAVYPAFIVILSNHTNPLVLAFSTQAAAASISLLILFKRRVPLIGLYTRASKHRGRFLLLASLMSGFIGFSYAAFSVSAAVSSLVVIELWPVLAFFIFPFVLRETQVPSIYKAVGACTSLVGAAVVSISQANSMQGDGSLAGIGLAFLAAVSTAFGTLLISRLSDDLGGGWCDMLLVQACGRLLSALMLALIIFIGWTVDVVEVEPRAAYLASGILAIIVIGGSTLFSKAVIRVRNRMVIKFWGFQPLLSVFALLSIGAGHLNWILMAGTALFVIGLFAIR